MNNDLISRGSLKKEMLFCLNQEITKYKTMRRALGNVGRVAIECVEEVPAVDAEVVVRCRDCKHRGIATECPMCYTEDSYDEDYGYDYWDVDKTVDDGFCHCGEVDAEVEG